MKKIAVVLTAIFTAALCFGADRAIIKQDASALVSGSEMFSVSAAFVAGVSDYTDGFAQLPGVRKDIDAVSAALSDAGFNVDISVDTDRKGFIKDFEDFLNKYSKDKKARLIVYFAGHGHTLKTEQGREGYIVFKNAADPLKNREGFLADSLPVSYFARIAKKADVWKMLFVFDSCFSGSVFSTFRSVPELLQEMLTEPVRQFISSGTENQLVPDDSVFRRRFIGGIRGGADRNTDYIITGSELGLYLSASVSQYTSGTQTPVFGKLKGFDGEFVFFNRDIEIRQEEPETVDMSKVSEKEKLIAVIRENPHSPDAEKAMKRLREIDSSLENLPPVEAPEREDFVMTAKSVRQVKFSDDFYPYIILEAVKVPTSIGIFKAAMRIKAADQKSYIKLVERKAMLNAVMSRRMKESNLQLVSDIKDIRSRIRKAAEEAAQWVCPGCVSDQPAIAGLMGL